MNLSAFTPASALVTVVVLALAPFVAVMVTSFVKIVVVLSLLRNALGLQQVPPNIVLNGLALVLTIFVMQPVAQEMSAQVTINAVPTDTSQMLTAFDQAKEPLRAFLLKHSAPGERAFLARSAAHVQRRVGTVPTEHDFVIAVPAFVISELSSAFQIGFLIFLPFLVIDLVISNILLAMGMMMLSPTTISLPFKLLLFVLIDGWVKLAHGLLLSYN